MKTYTFTEWKKTLDDGQIDFILKDYFTSHHEYNPKSEKLEVV